MISVADALARMTAFFDPLPAETVPLSNALGRVLAADVTAKVTQPPLAVSAMDGYAARHQDVRSVPVTLDVIGRAPAGAPFDGTVGEGQAVRIFTGGPVPDGADAIVIQEDTEADGDRVRVKEGAPAGRYVRPAGLDFSAGETGLEAGRILTARDIGLAAAMNVPALEVHRQPRVALLSTGDELVPPGGDPKPGQIISSNNFALAAFITACGGVPVDLGIAPDDETALVAAAEGARDADLFLTSGGASVGEHDLIQSALEPVGLKVDFWKVAMRPGKPLIFGHFGGVPFLGLPGNPVSSLVCAIVYLRPILDRMSGVAESAETLGTARLGIDLAENDRRQDYLRATLSRASDGDLIATPFAKQDSSMLSRLTRADCLIVRAPHAPAAKAGARVDILKLAGSRFNI